MLNRYRIGYSNKLGYLADFYTESEDEKTIFQEFTHCLKSIDEIKEYSSKLKEDNLVIFKLKNQSDLPVLKVANFFSGDIKILDHSEMLTGSQIYFFHYESENNVKRLNNDNVFCTCYALTESKDCPMHGVL